MGTKSRNAFPSVFPLTSVLTFLCVWEPKGSLSPQGPHIKVRIRGNRLHFASYVTGRGCLEFPVPRVGSLGSQALGWISDVCLVGVGVQGHSCWAGLVMSVGLELAFRVAGLVMSVCRVGVGVNGHRRWAG